MAIYGQFEGEVTKVAPNTTQSERISLYSIKQLLKLIRIKINNSRISLQSGMMVDVSIIGEAKNSSKLYNQPYYQTIKNGTKRLKINLNLDHLLRRP